MKYHIMADHSYLVRGETRLIFDASRSRLTHKVTDRVSVSQPSADAEDLDDRAIKDKLRKILKRLGRLKCSKEVR